MKIVIIGSTQYLNKMLSHAKELIVKGHEVKMPAFDNDPDLDELEICEHNLALIGWADRVDILWDQRSFGTIFDFGMAFALRKPIKRVYIEPKTFGGIMKKYEKPTSIKK